MTERRITAVKCPNCKSDIPEEASFCLRCFTRVNSPEKAVVSSKKRYYNKKYTLILSFCTVIIAVGIGCTLVRAGSADKAVLLPSENATPSQPTAVAQVQTESASEADTDAESTSAVQSVETASIQTTASPITDATVPSTASPSTAAPSTDTTTSAAKSKTAESSNTKEKVSETTKKKKAQIVIADGVLKAYPKSKKNTSYEIPYKVKRIENGAFSKNKYLKTLKFSKRMNVKCDYGNLVKSLPNLKTVYIYPGTTADVEGIQYFSGKRVVYYD